MYRDVIEVLLYTIDNSISDKINNILSTMPVHVQLEQQLDMLPARAAEDVFDLFICQVDLIDAHTIQILQALRNALPVMFVNLITEQTEFPDSLPIHYVLPKTTAQNENHLTTHLDNVLRLTMMHKKQAELSALLLHDLRSPTQSIIGYIELLEQEVFGEVNEGQRQILLSASNLGDSIIQLMGELGQVYQFEKNEFELQKSTLDVKLLLDETLRALWVQADRKNIKFIPKIDSSLPELNADGMTIQRVLNNLVHNAIKFSPENSTVRIQVTAKKEELEFRIVDSGPGLAEDQIPLIFNKFYRITDRKDRQKGQGLGLYICKLIIEAHRGKIGVENNSDVGTTFIFWLPAK